MLGKRPQTKPCEAINGIVAEGEETIEDFGESAAIDTVWLQPAKRSNIMRWPATAHSRRGRHNSACPRPQRLLNQTLQEEMKAEKLLTQIGASKADKMAATKVAA